jgi:hypothetical protein
VFRSKQDVKTIQYDKQSLEDVIVYTDLLCRNKHDTSKITGNTESKPHTDENPS